MQLYKCYSPAALSTITLGTWKKMQKAELFRGGSLTSPEWKYIKSPKIPVVLNAWERKIQDGRHFADFENQTIANAIYDRVIYDLRGQKCIVIFYYYYSKVIITLLIEFLVNLLNKYISKIGKSAPFCIFFPGSY